MRDVKPKDALAEMGSYSSALVPEMEEFNSIVSTAERMNEQVPVTMEERSRGEEVDPPTLENSEDAAPASQTRSQAAESFSSLLPKALSAVLHPGLSPPDPQTSRERSRRNPANLQQLQAELRELREQFDQMKSRHNKEIKLLMSELDEEKRIRLTLQMEVQRMKKHMSK